MPETGSVYILTEELGRKITGGQKYNHFLFSALENGCSSVQYLDDHMFSRSRIPFLYNLIYLRLLFIADMDLLILDSRMYTRSFFIILLMRCLRSSVRIISIHHHFNYQVRYPRFLRPLDRFFELGFLRCCHSIIVPSPFTRDLCQRHALQKTIVYLPIGFDKKDLGVKPSRKTLNGSVLLCLGSMNRRKGTDLLIRALTKLDRDDWHLNIAGSYQENRFYKKIKRIISKHGLGDKVSLLGRVEEQHIPALFMEADCFLLPSRYEGFGMVIAEAFSYGLPVIAFDNSAMPYLINPGKNGILVKDGDHKAFSKAIKSILVNHQDLSTYHEHALQTYRDLPSLEDMQEGMKNWIVKLLKQ